jgi:hypothetical protein
MAAWFYIKLNAQTSTSKFLLLCHIMDFTIHTLEIIIAVPYEVGYALCISYKLHKDKKSSLPSIIIDARQRFWTMRR